MARGGMKTPWKGLLIITFRPDPMFRTQFS
jgi:hypothetical protein